MGIITSVQVVFVLNEHVCCVSPEDVATFKNDLQRKYDANKHK